MGAAEFTALGRAFNPVRGGADLLKGGGSDTVDLRGEILDPRVVQRVGHGPYRASLVARSSARRLVHALIDRRSPGDPQHA